MPRFLADVLTWPTNRPFITAIKAARDFSIPPSVLMLRTRQPSDGWSQADKKLAVAFQILEDETCPDCGIPIWIGHSDDEHIQFSIKSRTCYSCARVEQEQADAEKRAAKRKNARPQRGKKRFIQIDESDQIPSRQQYLLRENGQVDDG